MSQTNNHMGHSGWDDGHNREHESDPIARNPKDIDGGHVSQDVGAGNSQIVARHRQYQGDVPVLAANGPSFGQGGAGKRVGSGQSIAELIKSVLRFKWTIILVTILIAGPITAAIWTQIVPKYRARAEIRVRPIIPTLVFRTEDNGMIPLYQSFMNTQVSIIRNIAVLQRVLDQQEVQQTGWYKKPAVSLIQKLKGGPSAPPLERLREDLSVRPRPRTEIIDVSFSAASAKDAEVIVNAVLDQYKAHLRYMSEEADQKLYDQLVAEFATLKNEIEGLETTCANYRKTLGTGTPEELIAAKRVRIDSVEAHLSSLEDRIAVLEWERDQLQRFADNADANSAEIEPQEKLKPEYHEDAEWRRLNVAVQTKEHEIENGVLNPNHPEMVLLQRDLEFAKRLRREREEQLENLWSKKGKHGLTNPADFNASGGATYEERLESLEYQIGQAQKEKQLVEEDLKKKKAEFESLFATAQSLQEQMSLLDEKRELYDAVRRRKEQKDIERKVPGTIEVLTGAFASSQPVSDRRVIFTAMALFAGLGLGVGVAYLRAVKNQTIHEVDEMPAAMQTPFLGCIPEVSSQKWNMQELKQRQAYANESLRVVRTALLSRLRERPNTSVLVTSAAPGTGKSTFTLKLGASLALAGKRVVVIDADFRKNTLSRRLGLVGEPGFVDALTKRKIEGRYLVATETPGLRVMPSGRQNGEQQWLEQTANGAFKACMDYLRRDNDIILVDSAPILPVADATILSGQVDGTIMVERELVSQRTNVMNALARLSAAGGNLLGTVFVCSPSREGYGYDYTYSGSAER